MTTHAPTLAPTTTPSRATGARLLASERIKLTSLRSMRWLGAVVLLLGVVGAVLPTNTVAGVLLNVGTVGAIGVGLLGALASTGEYATGTIRPTMTAVPRRLRAVAAKTVVVAATGAVLAVVSTVITVPVLPAGAREGDWLAPYLLSALGLVVFWAAVASLMCLVGFAVRSVPVAVVIAVVFLFLVPGIFGGFEIGDVYLSEFTPLESGGALVYDSELGSMFWRGLLVTLAWPTVAGVVAGVLVKRRDI